MYGIRNDKGEWYACPMTEPDAWFPDGGDMYTDGEFAKLRAKTVDATVVPLLTPEEVAEEVKAAEERGFKAGLRWPDKSWGDGAAQTCWEKYLERQKGDAS